MLTRDTGDGPINKFRKEDAAELGEVRVELCWARKAGQPVPMSSDRSLEAASRSIIPEKALKGRAISSQAT